MSGQAPNQAAGERSPLVIPQSPAGTAWHDELKQRAVAEKFFDIFKKTFQEGTAPSFFSKLVYLSS
jgi:hypothetical protein